MNKNAFGDLHMNKGIGMIDNVEIGKRIKEIRKEHRLTQEKFAEILGVTTTAIRDYESGQYGMSKDVLLRMRECFKVSLDYLLFGENVKETDIMLMLENTSDDNKMKILMYLVSYFIIVKNKGNLYDIDINQAAEKLKNLFLDNE